MGLKVTSLEDHMQQAAEKLDLTKLELRVIELENKESKAK